MKVQRALQGASLAVIAAAFFALPTPVGAGESAPNCDAGGAHSGYCIIGQNGKSCTQDACDDGYYPCCTFGATNPHCECVKGGGGEYEQ